MYNFETLSNQDRLDMFSSIGKIRIPSGRDTIEPGDTVIVVTSTIGLSELDAILRPED